MCNSSKYKYDHMKTFHSSGRLKILEIAVGRKPMVPSKHKHIFRFNFYISGRPFLRPNFLMQRQPEQ